MNYEGRVTSVNTILWTFDLDSRITVHLGHLAAYNSNKLLPEIGEHIEINNAHFLVNKLNQLNKLFLCEKSSLICCHYKSYIREDGLLDLIKDLHLGVSDLLEIDYNLAVIDSLIKPLTEQSSEHILFQLIRATVDTKDSLNTGNPHECLNKVIQPFTLKTVSNYCYVNRQDNSWTPLWSFGTYSKAEKSDKLVSFLHINKRYGIVLLYDANYKIPCLITAKNKSKDLSCFVNKLVVIDDFRVFSEVYSETDVPTVEYILFDIDDVMVLNINTTVTVHPLVFKIRPDDYPLEYQFCFQLLQKFVPNIFKDAQIECWLEVLIGESLSFLCLNAYQVQVLPLLEEGATYQVYHSNKLENTSNKELQRINTTSTLLKFSEKSAIFVYDSSKPNKAFLRPILTISEVLKQLKTTNTHLSFQGLLKTKKLTPALNSRTSGTQQCAGFGTPSSKTHSLIFISDTEEDSLLMYLNNWENLQIPLGLIPYMRVCVKNAVPQKCKYLKACVMTTVEVLSYEPPIFFNTANLSTNLQRDCDRYAFIGWGNLIPCNALVWGRISEIYVRSLKIMYKCRGCKEITSSCNCGSNDAVLETIMTLYVCDEMGQALVISRSTQLLRLMLQFQTPQWEVWCQAFKDIKEYVHDNDSDIVFSQDSIVDSFCKALALSIKLINTTKMTDLELLCRKMDISNEDNEGMPKWFCIDARNKAVIDCF